MISTNNIKRIVIALLVTFFIRMIYSDVSMADSIKVFDSVYFDVDTGNKAKNIIIYVDGELYGTNDNGKIAYNHLVNANLYNSNDKYLTDGEGKIILNKGLHMISDSTGYYVNNDGKVEDSQAYDDGKMYGVGVGGHLIFFNNVLRSEYLNDENGAVKKQGIYYVNKNKNDDQVYISKQYYYDNKVELYTNDKLLYYDNYFFSIKNRIIDDKHQDYRDTELYKEKINELKNKYIDKSNIEIDKIFLATYVKIEDNNEAKDLEQRNAYYDKMLNGIQYDHKYDRISNGFNDIGGNTYLFKDGIVVRRRGIYKVSKIDDRGFFCVDGSYEHKTAIDKYYYFDEDSKIVKNDFIFDGDDIYYADEDGELLRNHTLGADLYFDSECKLVKGNVNKENVEAVKKKIFYDSLYNIKYNCPLAIYSNEKELLKINSIKSYYNNEQNINLELRRYVFQNESSEAKKILDEMTHIVLSNGELAKNMFINFYGVYKTKEPIDNNIYYFDNEGHPVKNSLIQVGKEKYIFDKNGKLIVSKQIGKDIYDLIDKETANFDIEKYMNKYIDASGVLIEDKVVVEISWPYSDEGSPSYTYMTID